MSQLILGSSHVIPQAAVLDCEPELVGDSLSVHLSQQSSSTAVWRLNVWVLIAQGWYYLGGIDTLPPSAGDVPARTVLIANCPGATGWRVECECNVDDEIAHIALQSSRCNSSAIGVVRIDPVAAGVTNVNIVGSIPLTVNATIVGPIPLPTTTVITSSITLPVQDVPWSFDFSTALANSFVVKGTPGTIRSVTLRVDGTLAAGTYYLQFWNLAAPPADATAVSLVNSLAAPVKVVHVLGVDDIVKYDFNEGGELFSAGASLNLSSTEFTKTTVAGAFISVTNAEFR